MARGRNRRVRREVLHTRNGRGGVRTQRKSLPGRTDLNTRVPGAEKLDDIVGGRPDDAQTGLRSEWRVPDEWKVDQEISHTYLRGVRVNNNSRTHNVSALENPEHSVLRRARYTARYMHVPTAAEIAAREEKPELVYTY